MDAEGLPQASDAGHLLEPDRLVESFPVHAQQFGGFLHGEKRGRVARSKGGALMAGAPSALVDGSCAACGPCMGERLPAAECPTLRACLQDARRHAVRARGAAPARSGPATRAHPGGGGDKRRGGCCPPRAAPLTGGSRCASLHGQHCLASSRAPATLRAALGRAGQRWAGLDRGARVPSGGKRGRPSRLPGVRVCVNHAAQGAQARRGWTLGAFKQSPADPGNHRKHRESPCLTVEPARTPDRQGAVKRSTAGVRIEAWRLARA